MGWDSGSDHVARWRLEPVTAESTALVFSIAADGGRRT